MFLEGLRMIMIDSKSQLTIDIITKVSQGKITINNAAKLLNRLDAQSNVILTAIKHWHSIHYAWQCR
jgi:hypothetical protein